MATREKRNLAKRLGTYSLAAGAAAIAGSVTDSDAAPIIYDTEATPIYVRGDYNADGQQMAIINPDALGASAKASTTTPTAAGLIGFVNETGPLADGIQSGVTGTISDGALTGRVYFRYQNFPAWTGSTKEGTQFGVLTGAGNGVYGFADSASHQPWSSLPESPTGDPSGYDETEQIGDGSDNLLTSDTATNGQSLAANAVQVDMDGFAFSPYDIVVGEKYLGFQLAGRNGFVKVAENTFSPENERNQFRILGWGIETQTGTAIHASLAFASGPAVPEPRALALLALGASGLLAFRSLRRRR